MIEDKNIPDRSYGLGIDFILKAANQRQKNDDDFFVLTIGPRSTGKSRLMLHMMESHMGERASMDYIGLRKGDFANALSKSSKIKLPRMCVNDEGNISSKEVMSKFNRAVMDVYFAIRGKNMFHNWCNPSIQGLDKQFIKEIVNGVIFTYTKYKNIRLYYYFTKGAILDILDKYKNLELRTLKKNAKKFAHHRGWFRDYKGFLLKDYIKKKESRMDEKIDHFANEWGMAEDGIMKAQVRKILGVSWPYFTKWEKKLKAEGKLEGATETASGRTFYLEKHIDIFRKEMGESRNGST